MADDDCDRTPICARMKQASWIYQGSFSKSLAPGLRLGFLAASIDLMASLIRLKQAADSVRHHAPAVWMMSRTARQRHGMFALVAFLR